MKTTTETFKLSMPCISENCGDKLTAKKRHAVARVTKLFLPLLLGLLFMSAITVPMYMSFQIAMQSLEPASTVRLQSLVSDIHPTAYLTQGVINAPKGEAPVVAICDAASVNLLYGNNPLLSQVEMVRITVNSVNDLPASIDLIQLEGLTNLKYLLVEFGYEACDENSNICLNSILKGFIEGNSSQIIVIYSPSILQ